MLGGALVLLDGLGMACGGTDTSDDDLVDDTASGGARRPGGGPTSGGTFGTSSSSSGRSGSSSNGGQNSSSGGQSGSSSSSGSGGQSSSGGVICADPDDAPDFEDTLGYTATTNAVRHTVTGVVDGELDVDWYGYDIAGSPTTSVSLSEGIAAELCVFYRCKAGTLTVTCNGGSASAVDEEGNSGCCATSTASVAAALTTFMYCSSAADDSYTMISITSRAQQCVDYTAYFDF